MRRTVTIPFPLPEPKREIIARVFLRAPGGYTAWVLAWDTAHAHPRRP